MSKFLTISYTNADGSQSVVAKEVLTNVYDSAGLRLPNRISASRIVIFSPQRNSDGALIPGEHGEEFSLENATTIVMVDSADPAAAEPAA